MRMYITGSDCFNCQNRESRKLMQFREVDVELHSSTAKSRFNSEVEDQKVDELKSESRMYRLKGES
jgi:pyruvate-formate lyase-activating enzyme